MWRNERSRDAGKKAESSNSNADLRQNENFPRRMTSKKASVPPINVLVTSVGEEEDVDDHVAHLDSVSANEHGFGHEYENYDTHYEYDTDEHSPKALTRDTEVEGSANQTSVWRIFDRNS